MNGRTDELKNQILTTLAFFDAQDLPLTLLEIENYLVSPLPNPPPSTFAEATADRQGEGMERGEGRVSEIEKVLEQELKDKVGYARGFYFLRGRDALVAERDMQYRNVLRRMRRARRFLQPVRFIPYVRAVAISGSLACCGGTDDSDIDLLIVTAKNRIWLARVLVSAYFHLLRMRRYGKFTKNRFCLNHYLDEKMVIERDQNLYTAVEYTSLIPVIGKEYFEKFTERNAWLGNFLSKPEAPNSTFFNFSTSFFAGALELVLETTGLGFAFNKFSKNYQKNRIEPQDYVLISDKELSFHPHSKGQRILARFDKIVN